MNAGKELWAVANLSWILDEAADVEAQQEYGHHEKELAL